MRPAEIPQLAPEPADGIPGKLAKPAKGEGSYRSQLSRISAAGPGREQGTISRCPFLSKPRWAGKNICENEIFEP